MENLFVYGTFVDVKVAQAVLARKIIESVPDKLRGYKKDVVLVDKRPCPILVPKEDSTIDGRVLLITNEELRYLDDWEPPSYERTEIKLTSGNVAWVYQYK